MITRVENNHKQYSHEVNKKISRAIEFSKVLENIEAKYELKISAHAIDRLKERNINLTQIDMTNLRNAVEMIKNKGGREALILYNNIAFITSVKNNTIITAVDGGSLKENVFTNIDSAVII